MITDILKEMVEKILELYFCGIPCNQAIKIVGQTYK